MAKLTRNQLKEIRQKFKDKKAEDLENKPESNSSDSDEDENLIKEREKDKLGLIAKHTII